MCRSCAVTCEWNNHMISGESAQLRVWLSISFKMFLHMPRSWHTSNAILYAGIQVWYLQIIHKERQKFLRSRHLVPQYKGILFEGLVWLTSVHDSCLASTLLTGLLKIKEKALRKWVLFTFFWRKIPSKINNLSAHLFDHQIVTMLDKFSFNSRDQFFFSDFLEDENKLSVSVKCSLSIVAHARCYSNVLAKGEYVPCFLVAIQPSQVVFGKIKKIIKKLSQEKNTRAIFVQCGPHEKMKLEWKTDNCIL